MNLLALDLSLTRTGWATHHSVLAGPHATGTITPPKGMGGVERLIWIRKSLTGLISLVELVVMEGYSYGVARGNALTQLGELGGVVRVLFHELGVPWVEVPPATLKKYATGKGNAGKAEVLVAAVRRLGYEGSDDNVADAMWLRAMALDAFGAMPSPVPKAQQEALLKIEWPGSERGRRPDG